MPSSQTSISNMTTNTVQTEFSTQRPPRPHHYNLHRTSRILQSQRSDSPPSPPPLRMENTVRILSALAPQLNVPQAPIKRAPSRSGRNTPSVDIYSGILEARGPPSLQPSRSPTPHNHSLLGSRHDRNRSSSGTSHGSRDREHRPLKESNTLYNIAARALRVRRGQTHPTSSESEACTIGSKNEFDVRSYTSSSSEAPSKNLRASASSTSSAFLYRPVSYHCDQDLSPVVIDIGPIPKKTKRKARPPPLSIPGSGSLSNSESDGFTPDSMITPASSSCSTARPWSHHSSPYSTAALSSVWPDQLPSDTTKEKIGLPPTSELLKKLPLLPPHDIPSPIASASESGELLEPRSPIPPKTPFLPSNRRASKSLPGLSSNSLAGAAPDDDHCEPEKGGHPGSPRGSTSRSERETIMRKRRLSDPVPSSFDSHTYTPLPPPKSVSPINLGLSFDSEPTEDNNVPAEGSESHRPTIYETPLGPERDQQQDPIRRSSIHDTGVLVISRPRAEVMRDDMDDEVSYVESHHHPTIAGMSDTESSRTASIYSFDSEIQPDLNSVLEEDLEEGNDIVMKPKRVSEMMFRPGSASSSDTFTPNSTIPPTSLPIRSSSLRPFEYPAEGRDLTTQRQDDAQTVGERRTDTRVGQDWVGEWSEPNIHQVISKLRALKS